MANMSYRQLRDLIEKMPEDKKDDTVTLALDTQECFAVKGFSPIEEYDEDMGGILDEGHFVLFVG